MGLRIILTTMRSTEFSVNILLEIILLSQKFLKFNIVFCTTTIFKNYPL